MNVTVKIMHRVYKYIFNQMRLLTIKSPTLEVIGPEQVCIAGATREQIPCSDWSPVGSQPLV